MNNTDPQTYTLTLSQPLEQYNVLKRAEFEVCQHANIDEVASVLRSLLKAIGFHEDTIRYVIPTEDEWDEESEARAKHLLEVQKDEGGEGWQEGSEIPDGEEPVLGYWESSLVDPFEVCRYVFQKDAGIRDDAFAWENVHGDEVQAPDFWKYIDAPVETTE